MLFNFSWMQVSKLFQVGVEVEWVEGRRLGVGSTVAPLEIVYGSLRSIDDAACDLVHSVGFEKANSPMSISHCKVAPMLCKCKG